MNAKHACAAFLGSAFLVLFAAIVAPPALSLTALPPLSPAPGAALWKGRTYEGLLQGMIILAGVLSILLLLGRKQSGGMPR